jgi:hypothetical protein
MRLTVLVCVMLAACATTRGAQLDPPIEGARHRAALATIIVSNATISELTIVFRSATPPIQEVTIGKVGAVQRGRMAPVPAGEPIVLIARRADGSQLFLPAQSLPIDVEWTWEIPRDATFVRPTEK